MKAEWSTSRTTSHWSRRRPATNLTRGARTFVKLSLVTSLSHCQHTLFHTLHGALVMDGGNLGSTLTGRWRIQ
jgi:hypothetical protein